MVVCGAVARIRRDDEDLALTVRAKFEAWPKVKALIGAQWFKTRRSWDVQSEHTSLHNCSNASRALYIWGAMNRRRQSKHRKYKERERRENPWDEAGLQYLMSTINAEPD